MRLITEPNALVFDFASSHERGGECSPSNQLWSLSYLAVTVLDENQEVCSVERYDTSDETDCEQLPDISQFLTNAATMFKIMFEWFKL